VEGEPLLDLDEARTERDASRADASLAWGAHSVAIRERDGARAEVEKLTRERDALRRAVSRVAAMAATLRAEAVGVSPGVQSIANKIAGEIEARLETA
jgi:hypothetical protein